MATFDFGGEEITAVRSDELTLGELTFIVEHYSISGREDLDARLIAIEPKAYRALLIAAARRADPEVDAWDERVDLVSITALLDAWHEEAAAEAAAKAAAKKAATEADGD